MLIIIITVLCKKSCEQMAAMKPYEKAGRYSIAVYFAVACTASLFLG